GKRVVVRSGRFGLYVTDGEVNATLRLGDAPETLTLDRAGELLAERRNAEPTTSPRSAKKAAKRATKKAPAKARASKAAKATKATGANKSAVKRSSLAQGANANAALTARLNDE
ncbi:MAG: hypothetical protein B7X07_02580, partial [Actinobacteria bacterium 21-64-8]